MSTVKIKNVYQMTKKAEQNRTGHDMKTIVYRT